jgi:cytochrome b involved in lipid metabolism
MKFEVYKKTFTTNKHTKCWLASSDQTRDLEQYLESTAHMLSIRKAGIRSPTSNQQIAMKLEVYQETFTTNKHTKCWLASSDQTRDLEQYLESTA